RSDAVAQPDDARGLGAVVAAEEAAVGLEPVTDDPAAAMAAHRREYVDRALEAVEGIGALVLRDLEGLVVVVSAVIAASHDVLRACCDRSNPRARAASQAGSGSRRRRSSAPISSRLPSASGTRK